jgi:beta-N-acetylhexosaminidase
VTIDAESLKKIIFKWHMCYPILKTLFLAGPMLWATTAPAQDVYSKVLALQQKDSIYTTNSKTTIATRLDSLDIMIGQMIMMGIEDRTALQATDPLYEELSQGKIGGVVLYAKNLSKANKPDSLKRLIGTMRKAAAIPIFVSIDEEGGRVHRLKEKDGFVAMPAASYLGRIDNPDSTKFYNKRLATMLHELGINVNYAPSVDMAVNPNNVVIGLMDRSYGSEPMQVARHAGAAIKSHRNAGVTAVAKHFPGHGSSHKDSHKWLEDVTDTWQASELQPFEELIRSRSVDAIMTAHIINQKLDSRRLPATLSDSMIGYHLRTRMGFEGVVFSDDMKMDAITMYYGLENAVALAINAGVDVLMFANTTRKKEQYVTASQMHIMIKQLVAEGKIPQARIEESFRRIMELKMK